MAMEEEVVIMLEWCNIYRHLGFQKVPPLLKCLPPLEIVPNNGNSNSFRIREKREKVINSEILQADFSSIHTVQTSKLSLYEALQRPPPRQRRRNYFTNCQKLTTREMTKNKAVLTPDLVGWTMWTELCCVKPGAARGFFSIQRY